MDLVCPFKYTRMRRDIINRRIHSNDNKDKTLSFLWRQIKEEKYMDVKGNTWISRVSATERMKHRP